MPDRIPIFEPEVEEILREVAADPNSYLLREPQRKGAIAPLDLEAGVSARTAGLTIAEKHLLQAWREEAAELLRQGFNSSLAQEPVGSTWIISLDLENSRIPRPGAGELRTRSKSLSGVGRVKSGSYLDGALGDLRSGRRISEAQRRRLIRLSYRIRPTDESRICIADSVAGIGQEGRSLAMYRSILNRSSSAVTQAYALANLVAAYEKAGDQYQRLDAALACVRMAPHWANSNQKLFRCHADLGQTNQAWDCLARILDSGPEASGHLEEYLRWMVAQASQLSSSRSENQAVLPTAFAEVAATLAERTRGELADLFAQLSGFR